jgi:hypothetical protein
VNESDPKLLDLQSALAEVQRLLEENVRLRRLLQEHSIQLPVVQSPKGIPVTTSALPGAHTPVLKAIRGASNETSFFQQVENRSPKEPLINGET